MFELRKHRIKVEEEIILIYPVVDKLNTEVLILEGI